MKEKKLGKTAKRRLAEELATDSKLEVCAWITSEMVHDPDDVPLYEGGPCRYWGAWADSPIPNVRLFVVFNREPVNDAEAEQAAQEFFEEED